MHYFKTGCLANKGSALDTKQTLADVKAEVLVDLLCELVEEKQAETLIDDDPKTVRNTLLEL